MSRREGRESNSKRHRSKFDQEPSPKTSRRDGKPAAERHSSNLNLDVGGHSEREKHRRRLQDALPLEAPPAPPDSKGETGSGTKEFDQKTNGQREGTKNTSNSTEVHRSRSSFQHNERGNAGQAFRPTDRRATSERGWWRDSKDRNTEKATEKTTARDAERRDEKSRARGDDNHAWRHNGFYETEADRQPPGRKRPPFSEKKIAPDSEKANRTPVDPIKLNHNDRTLLGSERREERGSLKPRNTDRPERKYAGDRESNWAEAHRGIFPARDRYGGGSNNRGRDRDRFNGRRGYQPSGGVQVEKWKHDMFEAANRSPTPKNEEDKIAKLEALLSS